MEVENVGFDYLTKLLTIIIGKRVFHHRRFKHIAAKLEIPGK